MRRNLTTLCLAVVIGCGTTLAQAAGGTWHTSFEKAAKEAKETDKPILADFTGSDWCPPCQMLAAKVFKSDEFKAWAKDNVVLLELDFPKDKSKQPRAIQEQNRKLQREYKIPGYPTVIIMTATGKEAGRRIGGHNDPEAYIKILKPMVAKAVAAGDEPAEDDEKKFTKATWLTRNDEAVKLAKAQDKPIMLHFTGSDWCPFCIKQHKEVFATEAFNKWATKNVVLFQIDFPDDTSKQTKEQQAEYEKLQEKYEVLGYPVTVFVNADGRELGRIKSYSPGAGVDKWLKAATPHLSRTPKAAVGKVEDQGHDGWHTSYDEAIKLSKKTGKPILADFTGSDWCPPCKALTKEVFGSDEFKKWAKKNVVLLELDFPRRKQLAPELKKQNSDLAKKYGIRSYPSILILDSDGKERGRTGGYGRGTGFEKWIKKIEPFLKPADGEA